MPSKIEMINIILLFFFSINKQTNTKQNKGLSRSIRYSIRRIDFLALGTG